MEDGKIHVSPERLKPLLHEGRTFKSADDFSLTKEDVEAAFLELHETERVRTSALSALKDIINCDQKLRYRTDENFLLRFLRNSKFDVDKAYDALRKFYDCRKNHPYAFSLSHVEQVLNTRFLTYLPYRDQDNCLFFWADFRNWNLDEWTIWDIMSAEHVVAEIISINPNVQIRGIKSIWDLRGVSLKHITHVVRPNTVMNLTKMMQIVFLGSDLSELHQHYEPAILPKEYGGTLEEKECYVTGHVMENMNYIMYERAFGHV